MSYWPDPFHYRRDAVSKPSFGVAIALSVLLHAAVLWQWKLQWNRPTPDRDIPPPLTVKLETLPLPGPPPAITAPPVIVPPSPRATREIPPPVAARQQRESAPPRAATPPVITAPTPAESAPSRVLPPTMDFATFVDAQRRARGEPSTTAPQPVEDENARATRLAAANLATPKAQGIGVDPSRSGGVFQIKSKGVDYAEFMFFGWHADARRDLSQLVEVRKGGNSTIELAVVRKMIEIIRTHEQADFPWRSHRLNRTVTLSARPRDTAGLEEFLMREFFYNPRIGP